MAKPVITILASLLWLDLAQAGDEPTVTCKGKQCEFRLPVTMQDALKKHRPGFRAWKLDDYSPKVLEASRENKAHPLPFVLTFDVNMDGKLDVVLDGRDDRKNVLLALVTKGTDIEVIALEEEERTEPAKMVVFDEGKKYKGISYFLSAPENPSLGDPVLYKSHPQQSDEKGQLLSDGGIKSFFYRDGKFESQHEPL